MGSDVDLAVQHALDLAQARGGRLASLTLCGAGVGVVVHALAMAALRRRGLACDEIRFEIGTGPVRLLTVELQV